MSTLSAEASRALARLLRAPRRRPRLRLSTFEKAIAANSAIIILATVAGWWVTQHNPETYHYLIDTSFIALAALLGVMVNFALLRAAFAPLHGVLATIRAVERGNLGARAVARVSDADAVALARAFNAMLDHLAALRDETAQHVLRAQEAERRRLALELHDQTGQSLTALALHAEAIAQGMAGERGEVAMRARAQAERLGLLAQRTLAEVQSIARQLRPPLLDDLGLVAALRWLAKDAGARLGLDAQVRVHGALAGASDDGDEAEPARLPEEVETALFRIAQESITNAVRHGHARRMRLVLRATPARVTLTLADDGQGFAAGHSCGLGLEGMRERARVLGGTLRVRTGAQRGCVVRATIPLSAIPYSARALNDESGGWR
jgi:two-component system sensor histidine kinase UhpB